MEQARPAASVGRRAFAPVVTAKDEAFEPESAIDEIWSGRCRYLPVQMPAALVVRHLATKRVGVH